MATPTVYLPQLVQIRAIYTTDPDTGDHYENVTWWKSGTAGTPTLAQLQAMQNIFDPAFGTVWKQLGSSNKSYLGSIITDWSSATGITWNSVGIFAGVQGLGGTSALPNQVSGLLSGSIPVKYKGGRARVYFPWPAVTSLSGSDNSQMTPSIATTMQTDWGTLLTNMLGSGTLGGQTWVQFRYRRNAALASAVAITQYTMRIEYATQRRRLRKAAHR